MPFDLSPWGFVRPAIHCNVVISKFISQKSSAPSIPELSFLFLFQGKRRREGRRESEALVGVKVLACATGATTRPRSRSRASRGSRGLPGPAGRALGTGSEGFFPLGQWRVAGSQPHSLPHLPLPRAEPGAPRGSAGQRARRRALIISRELLEISALQNDDELLFGEVGPSKSNFARVRTPIPAHSLRAGAANNFDSIVQVWQEAGQRQREKHRRPGFRGPGEKGS